MREIFKERKEKESNKMLARETKVENDKLKNDLETKKNEVQKLQDQLANKENDQDIDQDIDQWESVKQVETSLKVNITPNTKDLSLRTKEH